ncbi:hypothetical protein J0X12_07245 [Sneathiella sp. CAU 1612]|jgi:membrane protein implicated in regulation of membrane protease activity|uniref:Uncharacterized protein n=1 Tax=Sneathiella sedimenti TaxID=2816034 RepID=A0ABS3F617_9PROT|nr:hypothetical protein [Sneathiella sedimenti]MBO0333402.1 hypothetical protein [Sneathiella sedimenti]
MKLDTIALILAVFGGLAYLLFLIFAGATSPFPIGTVLFIVLAIFIYLLVRVLLQRYGNAEDDFYEQNIDQ